MRGDKEDGHGTEATMTREQLLTDPEQAAVSRQRLQTLGIRTFASGHWAPAVRI